MVCHLELPSLCQYIFVLISFFVIKKVLPRIIKLVKGPKPETPEIYEKNWKQDVVYLYQFPRIPQLPNVSPFCLKLETFLRLHKINYEVRYDVWKRSKYGLMPFVELNGEHLADSQLIMIALTKHFNLQDNLSPEQQAVAHYLQRAVEKHSAPLINREKMVYHADDFVRTTFVHYKVVPDFLLPVLAPLVAYFFRTKYGGGIRSSFGPWKDTEFRELLRKDLEHLRNFIGTKKFLFGDRPTTADATVFGNLANNFYAPFEHYGSEMIKSPENKVIADYLNRVRDEVWGKDFAQ